MRKHSGISGIEQWILEGLQGPGHSEVTAVHVPVSVYSTLGIQDSDRCINSLDPQEQCWEFYGAHPYVEPEQSFLGGSF